MINESQYKGHLIRIDQLMDTEDEAELNELDSLVDEVVEYEEKYYPIATPDPIDIIIDFLDLSNLPNNYLVGILGDKTTVSKVLSRKRKLNLGMIRRLHKETGIAYELLIDEY